MGDNKLDNNYSFADIDRYLNGQMTAPEMHAIERAALQDPFLSDALEGYREADRQQANIHVNELAALIGGEVQKGKIIAMPRKKSYRWQLAASVLIAVIGAGIVFFYKGVDNRNSGILVANQKKQNLQRDTVDTSLPHSQFVPSDSSLLSADIDKVQPAPKTKRHSSETSSRSVIAMVKKRQSNRAFSKRDQTENDRTESASLSLSDRIAEDKIALSKAFAYSPATPSPKVTDSLLSDEKPFLLLEVEETSLGKKNLKAIDTSTVVPEGGWQSLQDYLFTKMKGKDTLRFQDGNHLDENLELEFSLTDSGNPYDVKVIQTSDSAMAKTAAAALQHGPKWIRKGKLYKQLRLKY